MSCNGVVNFGWDFIGINRSLATVNVTGLKPVVRPATDIERGIFIRRYLREFDDNGFRIHYDFRLDVIEYKDGKITRAAAFHRSLRRGKSKSG